MSDSVPGPAEKTTARRFRWHVPAALRRLLRGLHRDAGYLAIGLTIIYATSGLAVNHIADWDPNFRQIRVTHTIEPDPTIDLLAEPTLPKHAAQRILSALERSDEILDAYATDESHLDVTLAEATLHVDFGEGQVVEEGQQDRALLRVANWLHLNRGKKAWTVIADTYAVCLLLLALTGLVMLPGRKGIFGRGGLFVLTGLAVPIAYVVLSGGP